MMFGPVDSKLQNSRFLNLKTLEGRAQTEKTLTNCFAV